MSISNKTNYYFWTGKQHTMNRLVPVMVKVQGDKRLSNLIAHRKEDNLFRSVKIF